MWSSEPRGPDFRSSLGRSLETLLDYPLGVRWQQHSFSIWFYHFFLLSFVPGFTTFCLIDLLSLFASFVLFGLFALMLMVKASCIGMRGEVRREDISFYVTISLVDFMRIHSFFGLLEVFEDYITTGLIILSCSSSLV
jgi:hypothetical protein